MEKEKEKYKSKRKITTVEPKRTRAKPVYIATKNAVVKFSEGRHVTLEKGKKVDVLKDELVMLKRMKFVTIL